MKWVKKGMFNIVPKISDLFRYFILRKLRHDYLYVELCMHYMHFVTKTDNTYCIIVWLKDNLT